MAKQISTKTPIRLHALVRGPFLKAYKAIIDEHGASYAVNLALADHLRKKGQKIPDLESPKARIAAGQRNRWKATKKATREAEKIAELRRQRKAAQEKRRRANRKAMKAAQVATRKAITEKAES